jgi:ATP phosphoribosyltransferase
MIRTALPKGRNLEVALSAFRAAGLHLEGFEPRLLRQTLESEGLEVLMLKDWDLPLYVEYGIADWGLVGSDVLAELDSDLLVPLKLRDGGCRFSLIGRTPEPPVPGSQIRVASKYPRWSQRLLEGRPWGAEIFRLSGSVELGPLLDLSEIACDIVQTGRTIRENGLHEIEVLAEVFPCFVVNRASFQRLREPLNELMRRLEAAEVVL